MTDYHWTPALQRHFLEALAETGSISEACDEVKMSRRAAYNLRHKRAGLLFALGWDAAVLVARTAIADTLMDRALHGHTEYSIRNPETGRTERFRKDSRLGLALLSRLDRMVERDVGTSRNLLPWIVSGDFEAFLDLLGDDAPEDAISDYFAARLPENSPFHCELAQISADAIAVRTPPDDPRNAHNDEEWEPETEPEAEFQEHLHEPSMPWPNPVPTSVPETFQTAPELEREPEPEPEPEPDPHATTRRIYFPDSKGPYPGQPGYPPQWLIDANRNGFR